MLDMNLCDTQVPSSFWKDRKSRKIMEKFQYKEELKRAKHKKKDKTQHDKSL